MNEYNEITSRGGLLDRFFEYLKSDEIPHINPCGRTGIYG